MRVIVVGTRGSLLALTQTRWAVERLKENWPDTEFKIKTIQTKGDRGADPREQNIFVGELEDALRRGDIDIAVHSLKDLPTTQPEGLEIAGVPRRVDPRDVFVGRNSADKLADLPRGARVGTSSVRRRAQLLAWREDLEIVPLRGNIDTRLKKLVSEDLDGIILAAAGLLRLDMRSRIGEFVDPEILLPSPGQGALALEVREGDDMADELAYSLNHGPTRARVRAERGFLHGLGAGCLAPVGALARIEDDLLVLDAALFSLDGKTLIRGEIEGDPAEAWELGLELAADVVEAGGREILEEVVE
jgi:hydroxymethylbilane synthase